MIGRLSVCLMRILPFLLLLVLQTSCDRKKHEQKLPGLTLTKAYEGLPHFQLTEGDTLCSYDDKYPVSLEILHDRLFVLFIRQDTLLEVLDAKTGSLIAKYGPRGSGPGDYSSLQFFGNGPVKGDSTLSLYDYNSHKILTVDKDLGAVQKEMPVCLTGEGSINMRGDTAVSVPLSEDGSFMSLIDTGDGSIQGIEAPFKLSDETEKLAGGYPMLMSPNLNASFSRRRIIASMFYFDIYYVYDLEGGLLSQVSLGSDNLNYDKEISGLFNQDIEGYIRYAPGYSNEEFCYLKRVHEIPDKENGKLSIGAREIVVVDWDGIPQCIYSLGQETRTFCADYSGNIYLIAMETVDDDELYHIVRYTPGNLPE